MSRYGLLALGIIIGLVVGATVIPQIIPTLGKTITTTFTKISVFTKTTERITTVTRGLVTTIKVPVTITKTATTTTTYTRLSVKVVPITITTTRTQYTEKLRTVTVPTTVVNTITKTTTTYVTISKTVTKTITLAPRRIVFSSNNAMIAIRNGRIEFVMRGYLSQFSLYKPGMYIPTYSIMAEGIPREWLILADYVYINSTHMSISISIDRVLRIFEPGDYTAILWSGFGKEGREVVICKVRISRGSIDIYSCRSVEDPIPISRGYARKSRLVNLLYALTPSEISSVGKVVFSGKKPKTLREAVWKASVWIDENIEYDYEKSRRKIRYVYTPSETISKGRGICIDYAVLYTALMLYAGFRESYILCLKNPLHAAALIYIDGVPIVLEQHVPPRELADYIEYDLGGVLEVDELLRVRPGPVIEVFRNVNIHALDSYPQDELPQDIVSDVLRYVHEQVPDYMPEPVLKSVAECGLGLSLLPCIEHSLVGNVTYPDTKLYTPIFHNEWAKYLASKIVEVLLKKGFKSLWLWASLKNDTLIIAYSKERPPHIAISTDGIIRLSIASHEDIEYLGIGVLDPKTYKWIAGIAGPGMYYKEVPTIYASKWVVDDGFACIEFSCNDLKNKLKSGRYIVAIWLKLRSWTESELVYALPIEIE